MVKNKWLRIVVLKRCTFDPMLKSQNVFETRFLVLFFMVFNVFKKVRKNEVVKGCATIFSYFPFSTKERRLVRSHRQRCTFTSLFTSGSVGRDGPAWLLKPFRVHQTITQYFERPTKRAQLLLVTFNGLWNKKIA